MTEPPAGIIGVFSSPQAITEAAHRLRALGLQAVEAYTPYPVAGLDAAMPPPGRALLPAAMLAGAGFGAGYGFFLQYWGEALGYPLNVGGRPYASWPAFTVSAFEFMLLCAVAAGFFALLAVCRLPRLYDPLFAADGFERASRDRFVLYIGARDPGFVPEALRRVLESCGAETIAEVPG
jgi:hypothetical protein